MTRPVIDPQANRDHPTVCSFCGQDLERAEFTPDRYGGYWHTKLCCCAGAEEARKASADFNRRMAGK